MTAKEIIDRYITFFEKRGHVRIPNAPLVPESDPTTLFTSSGMQPLVPYLSGEPHPLGKRLMNIQNVFRTGDIDDVGDGRHLTFYRMMGNWSLGDYFKKDQLPWVFQFLTEELQLDPHKIFVTVFEGDASVGIGQDDESIQIWQELFASKGIEAKVGERILPYGVKKNWWSRSGTPDQMPAGELGGPDSELFYDFGPELKLHENSPWKKEKCHVNCDCGRYWEIGNSVFMQYKKNDDGTFSLLPQQNVDFGGGLERLIGPTEEKSDMFQTSLYAATIAAIEKETGKNYFDQIKPMQIIAEHFGASMFIIANGVVPSNKDRGYILRKLLRRSLDNFYQLGGKNIVPILEAIVTCYQETDPELTEKFEEIKFTILEEEQKYEHTRNEAKKFIQKKYEKIGDDLMGVTEISAEDAFILYSTHGLSPTQIKSLGYIFDDQAFAEKMKSHKDLSRTASAGKFKGGLADASDLTIKGHTATHLLQKALQDVLGEHVHQTGSNITEKRLRFDFSHPDKLTDEEIQKVQDMVREKIAEKLPVHFEMLPLEEARKTGAMGLFGDKYQDIVKVYFIGGSGQDGDHEGYSKELCGGPHVANTGDIQSFEITKQEKIGQGQMRLYAVVQ